MTKRHRTKTSGNRVRLTPNRNVKDSLFCRLFGSEEYKENAVSLYNALSSVPCETPSELEIFTLEDAVYLKRKNDTAYLVRNDMRLMLAEAQSTLNPNMPLRGFIYFAESYSSYLTIEGLDIYGRTLVKIPTPQYVVLYNGMECAPAIEKLRLSDAFEDDRVRGDFEWTATVYNICHAENTWLFGKCPALAAYTEFNERIRKYAKTVPLHEAVDRAVGECIDEGILADYLKRHKAEVKMSVITEYNEELHEKHIRREGHEEGQEIERRKVITRLHNQPVSLIMQAVDGTQEFVVSTLKENGYTPVY